ncbi:MAG TPA: extracellular solute-binding protein [Candidatus Limnocylindrales bacterium]
MRSTPEALPRPLLTRIGAALFFALFLIAGAGSTLALALPRPDQPARTALGALAIVGLLVGATALFLPITWLSHHARRAHRPVMPAFAHGAGIRALMESASDPTILLDRKGTIRWISASLTQALGYQVQDLVGIGIDHIVSPPDVGPILAMLAAGQLAQDSARAQAQVRHQAGEWLTVEAVGMKLRDDKDGGDLLLTLHDVTRWKAIEQQLTRQAFHDPLTDLANRALFIDRLDHALGRRRYHARGAAVLFLDLDDFKNVNDSLGHVEGDNLIRQVATRLLETVRPGDLAARFGGDEFAILLDDVDEDQAVAVATRTIAALNRPFELTDRAVRIGATIGIALSSADLPTSTEMLRAADIAMYSAKGTGKGRFCVFEPSMSTAAAERLRLGVDIRGAVERGEFVVHYQPTVALPDGIVTGMEALVRWVHPELGLLPPADFIPLAESTGLIVQLGEFVLREACRQARVWQRARAGQPPLLMTVNLSGVQLLHPGLVASVSLALEDSELPPELLMLEITESVIAHETEETIRRLRQLKGLGVRIAVDDFGTGYSSLSYLRRFPVDTVKIDKSFVDGIARGPDELALVRAIVHLAHSLKMTTVAEGVELEGQARRLSRVGCDQAQGFYFAEPMDGRQATAYVVGHTTINLWVGHSGHELEVIREVVAEFEEAHPGIRVEVTGSVSDARVMSGVRTTDGPNVVVSVESDNFRDYASQAGFLDLRPFMNRDGIDPELFTPATLAYTRIERRQWALPLLADTYGLYFNTKLFAEAGLDRPPRTMSELTDCAKRLTKRNPDGSLRVVGFNPLVDFYENTVVIFGQMFGASWNDGAGRSGLASDPAWARMFAWQKELIDWYGYDDLQRFTKEVGQEFAPSNAFQMGRLGMALDGEWRIAFIAAEAPHLEFGTAPFPVDDARPDLYGSGYINGSVIGIPLEAGYVEESWKLVRYLATDDRALARLSNGLRNVPSTRTSLRSPDLLPDDRFAVFLDVFAHPQSGSTQITAVGSAYQELLPVFAAEWQAGQVSDLKAGLRRVDQDTDARLQQSARERQRLERHAA